MTSIKFNGNGSEYFKIWIINLLLTIVTLGFYRPWAKVRTMRYFYGNTEIDNANFEYHATGKQLFKSYLIAIALFVAYVVLSQMSPILSLGLAIAFIIALPWIIWRSTKFTLGVSSYRNVKFGFNGSLSGSYIATLGYPIGLLLVGIGALYFISQLSIWLAVAFAIPSYLAYLAMVNKVLSSYFMNGAQLGQGQFSADLEFGPIFMVLLKAFGLLLLFIAAIAIVLGLSTDLIGTFLQTIQNIGQGKQPSSSIYGSAFIIYLLFISAGLYVQSYTKAKLRVYLLNSMKLDKSVTFKSTLTTNQYFIISLTNLVLLICTLGLAYPWAAVRLYRCTFESISVHAEEGFDSFIARQGGDESPLGEELGDVFNTDIGGLAF